MKANNGNKNKNSASSPIWWLILIILTAVLVFINSNILTVAIVSGDSMYPSLMDGDFLIVDRTQSIPTRGDVVLIRISQFELGDMYIIKRVIATGDESLTIDYERNEVYIDGVLLCEPYISQNGADPMLNEDSVTTMNYTVPDGYVFVMGDNRNHSMDSRDEEIGFISTEKIIGKVIVP